MKDWTARLNAPASVVVKPAPVSIAGMKAGQVMLVPTPRMIDDFVRSIPFGRQIDTLAMRGILAERHGAEVTCPISTGYHIRTVAEAACEALERGVDASRVTPFWRVLDARSPTTGRLACGADFVRARRRAEGLRE